MPEKVSRPAEPRTCVAPFCLSPELGFGQCKWSQVYSFLYSSPRPNRAHLRNEDHQSLSKSDWADTGGEPDVKVKAADALLVGFAQLLNREHGATLQSSSNVTSPQNVN